MVTSLGSVAVTIKVVAERTGVSVHTLRAWERRFEAVLLKKLTKEQIRFFAPLIEQMKNHTYNV